MGGSGTENVKNTNAQIAESGQEKFSGKRCWYVNPKLITWYGRACHTTRVLKIGSVYRQGSNYHLHLFLKKCKYTKRDTSFESQLSDDEEGFDTVM